MLERQQEGKLRQHRLFVSVIAALAVLALAMVCLTGCSGGGRKIVFIRFGSGYGV